MADLPDLDTSNISGIAYWNAIDDGGVSDISPDEVLSSGRIISSEYYDNGVQGEIDINDKSNLNTTITGKFRVKGDGWFVVWLTRGDNFSTNDASGSTESVNMPDSVKGWWNMEPAWATLGYGSDDSYADSNGLSRAINYLQSELSNSGSISFSHSDVGNYNYHHPASVLTVLSSGYDNVSQSGDFSYSDSTELVSAVATGGAFSHTYDASSAHTKISADNTITLASASDDDGAYLGAIDAGTQIPSSGTTYGQSCSIGNSGNTSNGGRFEMFILFN